MKLMYPLLAQIFFTFVVMVITARSRVAALRTGAVKLRDIALSNTLWPDRVKALGNNLNNQFETPVLFYALIGAAIYTGATSWAMAVLAWGFVLSRIAHTMIHTGGNNVLLRFRVFVAGIFMLMAMWAGVLLRVAGVV